MSAGSDPLISRPKSRKKLLGKYYTPKPLSDALAQWGIRTGKEIILEPSFGGCQLLDAALRQLTSVGRRDGIKQLYGCDLDWRAVQHLNRFAKEPDLIRHFKRQDFLTLKPGDFSQKFDLVIGNPPYVSRHHMSLAQRTRAEGANPGLARGSLWAHFVLHALRFLRPGARVAWVLPPSLLYADYSTGLRNTFAKEFSQVLLVRFTQRMFTDNGTSEASVILLGDGWKHGPAIRGIELTTAASVEEFNKKASDWSNGIQTHSSLFHRLVGSQLSQATLSEIERLTWTGCVSRLGDLAEIKIGLVTGDNAFFVINSELVEENGLQDEVLPIIGRGRQAPGLAVLKRDLNRAQVVGDRCLLLSPNGSIGSRLARYLETYPNQKRLLNVTFSKRTRWEKVELGRIPDAFLTYMSHSGPRIVLNSTRTTSTNSVHHVFFKTGISRTIRKVIAISMQSSFSQLSAELEGRSYGAGILKHEPSEASRIAIILPSSILIPQVNDSFVQIDKLLRANLVGKARELADEFLQKHSGIDVDLALVSGALSELRRIRHK